jgi:excisionase family DNA binding protein
MPRNNRSVIPDPETKPLLRVTEVADLMGWSKNTVYALIHDGQLGAIPVQKRFYVPTTKLREFLALPPDTEA